MLGDYINFTKGFAFKSSSFVESGIKIVKVGNLNSNMSENSDWFYVSSEDFDLYKKYQIIDDDVIISTVGSWENNPNSKVGKACVFNKVNEKLLLNQNAVIIRTNDNKILRQKYLKYLISSKNLGEYLIGCAQGSANQASITLNDIRNYNVVIPSVEMQDKVVEIIESIFLKININNEINNNLHEYAKELFKNWFIDFNYPNSNEDRIESELGLIPKGWSVGYFDDGLLTEIIKSGVSKFDGEKKYIATADVDDSNINSYTMVDYSSKPSRANMTPIADSIWFAKMEGSKKNILVTNYTKELIDDYIFSTGFMGIKCLNNSTDYLWEIINSEQFQLEKDSLSTGTLMAGISNSTIKNYKYLIPSKDVLDNYNEVMTPINNKIYNNQVENEKLSQLRDTLLPKLMNGEINLDNIEI